LTGLFKGFVYFFERLSFMIVILVTLPSPDIFLFVCSRQNNGPLLSEPKGFGS